MVMKEMPVIIEIIGLPWRMPKDLWSSLLNLRKQIIPEGTATKWGMSMLMETVQVRQH